VKLFAFVKRKDGMTREEFLDHWRNRHGPLIRDTPGLGDRTIRYVQHAAHPNDRSGFDGVAEQQFASWDDFVAMIGGPEGELMRADEANFLDPAAIRVVFTDDSVTMVDRTGVDGTALDRTAEA